VSIVFQQIAAIPQRVEGRPPGAKRSLVRDFLQTVKFSQIRQADCRSKVGLSLDTRGRGASMRGAEDMGILAQKEPVFDASAPYT
jgi:hypothetical protein